MRKLGLIMLLAGAPVASAQAAPLSAAEAKVCANAKACADIVLRHRPSAFDYDVLAGEFVRLSPAAGQRLVKDAKPEQLANILRLAERARPEVAMLIGLDLAASGDPAKRALAADVFALDPVSAMVLKPGKRADLGTLTRMSAERPGLFVTRLLAQHPIEAARPGLITALGSDDPDAVALAYQTMFDAGPPAAFGALVAHMRAADRLPNAVAVGRMIAARDAGRADGFYAKMLDDIANDAGYPQAMRDGARAGSFAVSRPGAPLSASADLAGQIARLSAAGLLPDPDAALTRSDAAARDAWLRAARNDADLLEVLLIALPIETLTEDERGAWIDAGLRDTRRARTVQRSIEIMPLYAVGRWESVLQRLAASHPIDRVRHAATQKLERVPSSQATAALAGSDIRRARSARGKAGYCVDGTAVSPDPEFALMPLFEEEITGWSDAPRPRRTALSTSYPAQTRWLAGYSDRSGRSGALSGAMSGALAAFDYADGAARLIATGSVQLITPDKPPAMGRQPDYLWVFHDRGLEGEAAPTLSRVRPDGATSAEFVHSLPAPITQAYRLDDDSLLLHFHRAEGPFQPRVTERGVVPGWIDSHPPLRLRPDGALLPGCKAEALAGGRPDATP